MVRKATTQAKLNWIQAHREQVESTDLREVAQMMIRDGLYSDQSYVGDIVIFLRKSLGQRRTDRLEEMYRAS
jgi:hypothetical protein